MSKRHVFRFLVLVALAAFFTTNLAIGDELYANIRGVVTDSTGAVLPNVPVKATNVDTGLVKQVSSNSSGQYEFVQLPVGTYNVNATKPGFKTFQTTNIMLSLNQVYVLPIHMSVGDVSQEVVVEANPTQVESTSTQLGTVISGNIIRDMPLINRDWVTLQQLQPGVVSQSDRFGDAFATNGSQSQQNSFLINGQDSNDLPLNTPIIIPSPDAIGEFNLVTNTINPEYGRNSGAILNAIIRSGSNAFHGSGFEFYRDTFLNTKNFFQKTAPIFHRNDFGGTIGGPIWKNHTFFFFSYEGTRQRQPQAGASNVVTVFTPAERAGMFGTRTPDVPDKNGNVPVSPIPITSNGVTYPAGTAYNTIFAGGFNVDPSSFNAISTTLMNKFVPLPNLGTNQFSFNPTTQGPQQNQELFRIDHTLTSTDTIWGYGFFQSSPSQDSLPFTGSTLPGFPEEAQRHSKQFVVAWNHTFSPTTLNEARIGYTRFNFIAVKPVTATLPSTVGFQNINPQDPAGAGLPLVDLSGGGLFALGFSNNGPQPRIDQTYQFTDNFSKVIGKHTYKAGFETRRFHVSNPFFFNNNGAFTFGGSGAFSTGNAGADFLLGIPDSYGQSSGGFIDSSAQQYYSYAQDQWKVRPNLTLNYGVGWQIDTPLTDHFNHSRAINCFRPGQQSTVFPTAPAGLVFPGDANCNASGYHTKWDHLGPRLGVAWSPDWGRISGGAGKTSVRAGVGVYFNRSEEEQTLQNLTAPPFQISSAGAADFPLFGSPGFTNPFVDISGAGAIPQKFPFSPPAAGSAVNFGLFEPFSLNVIDPKTTTPYAENYNLTIEREMPGRMVLSVGYVGAVARHLEAIRELNPGINQAGCAATPACVANRVFQNLAFPNNFAFDGSVFGSIGQQETTGRSNYNSLQASLKKDLTHGLNFLVSYTYAHSLDIGSSFENSGFGNNNQQRGTNPFNSRVDYGDSQFDVRHRLVVSYTYDLPKLHAFNALHPILNGWKITGITTLQTGFPVGIEDTGFRSLACEAFTFYQCPDVPNVLGPVHSLDPRNSTLTNNTPKGSGKPLPFYWFDPNNFTREALGTFGNARRNFFHGPGLNNTDFAIFKDFGLGSEQRYVELRLETYNTFNHTQFDVQSINGNINSANFGRISKAFPGRLVQLGAKIYF